MLGNYGVMSAKNAPTARAGAVIGGASYILFAFVPMFLAYSATLVDPQMFGALLNKDPQLVLPRLILLHTPVFAQIIFFGAVLSAIMSCSSATLLAPSVVTLFLWMIVPLVMTIYFSLIRYNLMQPESADELLQAILGNDAQLAPLKRLLVTQTEGNPFFLEECVQSLVEVGALAGDRGQYRLDKPVETLQMPPTVQAVKRTAGKLDYPRERRAEVTELLRKQNVALGAGAETQSNLARLEKGAVAIVTALHIVLGELTPKLMPSEVGS